MTPLESYQETLVPSTLYTYPPKPYPPLSIMYW